MPFVTIEPDAVNIEWEIVVVTAATFTRWNAAVAEARGKAGYVATAKSYALLGDGGDGERRRAGARRRTCARSSLTLRRADVDAVEPYPAEPYNEAEGAERPSSRTVSARGVVCEGVRVSCGVFFGPSM